MGKSKLTDRLRAEGPEKTNSMTSNQLMLMRLEVCFMSCGVSCHGGLDCGTVRGASSSYLIITFFASFHLAMPYDITHSTHGQATNFFPGNVNINSPSICGAEAEAKNVVPEAFSKTAQKKSEHIWDLKRLAQASVFATCFCGF